MRNSKRISDNLQNGYILVLDNSDMFGYIYVNKGELKIREFEQYRAHYCGLCRRLYDSHGLTGRLTLNYDMTFLKILLENLYDPEMRREAIRCILHPFRKHFELVSDISDYCSDMNILLAYYNAADDWHDDRKILKGAAAFLLKRRMKTAAAGYEKKAETVRKLMEKLSEAESSGTCDTEDAACIFGEIMKEIFIFRDDYYAEDLGMCGFYLGKFIYFLDAYEDVDDDIKSGSYNPLKEIRGKEDFDRRVYEMLRNAISKSALHFERLPVTGDVEILRNILYAGCWGKFETVKERRTDGSIQNSGCKSGSN